MSRPNNERQFTGPRRREEGYESPLDVSLYARVDCK